jgi:hypothetical protein
LPSPYGEARRLGYFRVLMEEAIRRGPIDMDTFLLRVVERTRQMHSDLQRYIRSTGKMETIPVARNYSRFADFLELIKIESGQISATGPAIFFAHLDSSSNRFLLSKDERLAYFFYLWEKSPGLKEITSSFNPAGTTSVKTLRSKLPDEHLTETYSEWLVDLGLAKPTGKTRGTFYLLDEGHKIGRTKDQALAASIFASSVLSEKVEAGLSLPSDLIWGQVVMGSDALSPEIRRGFDKSIIPAMPVLLQMQLEIVKRYHKFFTVERLLDFCRKSAKEHGATFKWDPIYRSGYIRFKRSS